MPMSCRLKTFNAFQYSAYTLFRQDGAHDKVMEQRQQSRLVHHLQGPLSILCTVPACSTITEYTQMSVP